jgi:GNAT superfamily N-acetyltransferase
MINIQKAKLDDIAGIATVHVDTWKTTYNGIIDGEFLRNIRYDDRIKMWGKVLKIGRSHVFVAIEDSKVIGFSSGGPERSSDQQYDAELYTLYILQKFQRKGIGKRLLASVCTALCEQKLFAMKTWVLCHNPSTEFYKKMGGIKIGEKYVDIGDKKYLEIAYGWNDIRSMTADA